MVVWPAPADTNGKGNPHDADVAVMRREPELVDRLTETVGLHELIEEQFAQTSRASGSWWAAANTKPRAARPRTADEHRAQDHRRPRAQDRRHERLTPETHRGQRDTPRAERRERPTNMPATPRRLKFRTRPFRTCWYENEHHHSAMRDRTSHPRANQLAFPSDLRVSGGAQGARKRESCPESEIGRGSCTSSLTTSRSRVRAGGVSCSRYSRSFTSAASRRSTPRHPHRRCSGRPHRPTRRFGMGVRENRQARVAASSSASGRPSNVTGTRRRRMA